MNCGNSGFSGIRNSYFCQIMGHSRMAVTMEVYNHVSLERSSKEMGKLEKVRLIGQCTSLD